MYKQNYGLIEKILIEASMKRSRIHWAQIFAHSTQYIGAKEKQEIKKLADKWGVEIINR